MVNLNIITREDGAQCSLFAVKHIWLLWYKINACLGCCTRVWITVGYFDTEVALIMPLMHDPELEYILM